MVMIVITNCIDLYMLYLYVDVVIGFMRYLDFGSNPVPTKIFKIVLYFGGIPLGIIRIVAMEIIYWKWTVFLFSDNNDGDANKMLAAWANPFYVFSRYIEDIFPTIIGFVALFVMNLFGSDFQNTDEEAPIETISKPVSIVPSQQNTFVEQNPLHKTMPEVAQETEFKLDSARF